MLMLCNCLCLVSHLVDVIISPDHGEPGDQAPRRHQEAAGDAGHAVREVLRPAPVAMVYNGLHDNQDHNVGDDLDRHPWRFSFNLLFYC